MNALDTSASPSSSAPRKALKQFAAARLPIEEPIGDFEDAVADLKACSSTELRRALRHHRRAIESLQEGGYNALSEDTRDHLLAHLRSNLEAINQALDATASHSTDSVSSETGDNDDSLFARVRALVQGLW